MTCIDVFLCEPLHEHHWVSTFLSAVARDRVPIPTSILFVLPYRLKPPLYIRSLGVKFFLCYTASASPNIFLAPFRNFQPSR